MTKIYRDIAKRLFSVSVMVLFLLPCMVMAATIHVPADQLTIQAGIDAAVAGDTVLVADGTYTGEGNRDIDFKGKAITVQSENGAENCVIDCEDYSVRGFYFHTGETQTSVLKGFTVKNSNVPDSGAITVSSSPTITGCTISGNSGYGINCIYSSSSSPTITGCTISGNGSNGIHASSSPTITGCTISGNGSNGIWAYDSTISGCTISGNADDGIWACSSMISGCTISGNSGHGIQSGPSSSNSTISGCTISGNGSNGIYCTNSSSPWIENCLITGNGHDDLYISGGGIYSYSSSSSPTIINCTISGNTAYNFGGLSLFASGVIKNTIVWGNTPNTSEIDSFASVKYSDIAGYSGGGDGNIDEDPSFVGNGDYRLSANSPCINTGTSSGAPDTDIVGTSRPQGSGFDMGAYEYIPPAVPTVTTTAVSSISNNSVVSGGNVSSAGSASVTSRGVCWSTSANPTTGGSCTSNGSGTGSFTSNLTGLNSETSYHVRAYATNSVGTGYGNDVSFSTCPNCSGGEVNLTNKTFPPNGNCECIGTVSITIGAGVNIPKDATVTFKAPKINVEPGFHAENGSNVTMQQ